VLVRAVLLTVACICAGAHPSAEPVPRDRADQSSESQFWRDREARLNRAVRQAGKDAQVIFIGDSITQGWETVGKQVWEAHYARYHALNLGIAGDATQHVLWRLDHGNLEGLDPKAIVIMIGVNNLNLSKSTVEETAEGVAAVVQKLREKLPEAKVLLMGILPVGQSPGTDRGEVLQVNQIIENLDDKQNVFWIDIGHKFVSRHGLICRDLMPDYVHPSIRGYQIWADAIDGILSAILDDKSDRNTAAKHISGATDLDKCTETDRDLAMPEVGKEFK
jgi:lysophospholipase L1-like esterase